MKKKEKKRDYNVRFFIVNGYNNSANSASSIANTYSQMAI